MQRPILSGLIALLLMSCDRHPHELAAVPQDGYQNGKAFLGTIKHYPYVAPPERTARMIEGARKLHRCMTKHETVALLGEPDYSEPSYGPKGPNEHWLGWMWMFYISKRSDMDNLKDPRIVVFFDTAGRAHWIVPTGIEGAAEIGAPAVLCPPPAI